MSEPLLNSPGFAALFTSNRPEEILAQLTPESSDDPRVRAYLEELMQTEEGRELLERHRSRWDKHAVPAPSDRPTATEPMKTPATEELDDGDGGVSR